MEPVLPPLIGLVNVFLLVLGNAFFVGAEFALVRSHVTKLKSPEMNRKFGVSSGLVLIENLDLSLSATQLGITLLSLLLGWLGENTFAHLTLSLFEYFGSNISPVLAHGLATAVALTFVTCLHVVLGELCAKSVAIRYPEEVLRLFAPLLLLFAKVCRPMIFLFTSSANLVLGIFGMKAVPESERVHSPVELSMLISQSTEYGVLDKSEEEMLKGIFGFSETVAREVMTPRMDLVTIPYKSSFEEMLNIVNKSGYSRFPIIGDSIDSILGVLLARDLLALVPEYLKSNGKSFDIKRLLREPYFIPGTKPIDDLLNEFKGRKLHMAIVLDEHGGMDGAVTLEDLIEEIVGDIFDESDKAENDVVIREDGDILLDGGLLVADVNEKFELKIPEGDYDTVSGFIFSALGRMAEVGDSILLKGPKVAAINDVPVQTNGSQQDHGKDRDDHPSNADEENSHTREAQRDALFVVEALTGNRIETIRLHKLEPAQVDSQGKGSTITASPSETAMQRQVG